MQKSRSLLYLAFLCLSFSAFAVEERISACALYDPQKKETFESRWAKKVEPFFETGERGSFLGQNNIPVVYRKFNLPESKRAVVIVPGYAESSQKYKEVIYQFNCLGYSVYFLSHSGMGESGRNIRLKNRQIVHIEKFNDYVLDLEKFMEDVVLKEAPKDLYLFAHSTGGLISAHVLSKHDNWFRAAVLSAPLFELNLGNKPYWPTYALLKAEVAAGLGKDYALGYKDYDPAKAKFTKNTSTRDLAHYDAYSATHNKMPAIWMGGPSNNWVKSILDNTWTSQLKALAKAIRIPILLQQAGNDALVRPGGQNVFCKTTANCKPVLYKGSFHEIWRELDEVRLPALEDTENHFLKN